MVMITSSLRTKTLIKSSLLPFQFIIPFDIKYSNTEAGGIYISCATF